LEFSLGGFLLDMDDSSADKASAYSAKTNLILAFGDSAFTSNSVAPFLSLSAGAQREESGTSSATTARIGAGAGVLIPLFGDHSRLRLQAEYVYLPSSDIYAQKESLADLVMNVGVQFDLGDRTDTRDCNQCDTDSDGVSDIADYCPGTIFNAPVDDTGCVGDADGDGVNDVDDRCFATAEGITVDIWGCPPDADRDGVPDQFDQCPNSAPNLAVNLQGCFVDSDFDGVSDTNDQCPRTHRGVVVDQKGCEPDSDSDGIVDRFDRCPATPEGVNIGSDGCQLDRDGDGVVDSLDQCPDQTAEKIDALGCPVAAQDPEPPVGLPEALYVPEPLAPVKVAENPVVALPVAVSSASPIDSCAISNDCQISESELATQAEPAVEAQVINTIPEPVAKVFVDKAIQFPPYSAVLLDSAKPSLDRIADEMTNNKAIEYEVRGHTDGQGSAKLNQELSDARAHAVRDYLMQKGISGWRVYALGVGSSEPVASDATKEGRAENRRVEFRLRGGQ
jgi:outer membrane protein OmpA-like peptidoglycan-associated protein